MTTTGVRARRVAVVDDVRDRVRIGRIDYQSAFRVAADPADRRTAEQWARAMYESPPTLERLFVWFGWRACTARLGPYPSDDHVLGYRIQANEPNCVSFGVEWALGLTCELVLSTGASAATLASFVRLERPAARIVWAAAVPIHERVVPRWLARAARSGRVP